MRDPGMDAFVVPALAVDGIGAEDLDRALLNLAPEGADHAGVFILEETSHGTGEYEDGLTGVAEDESLHVAAQFVAVVLEIFAIHAPVDCK